MKKFITTLFIFFVFLLIPQKVDASLILPPEDPNTTGFLGQTHSYSVLFRGNGEAVVSLKVDLTNSSDYPIQNIKLRLPNITPQNIYAVQLVKNTRVCKNWYYDYNNGGTGYCQEYENTYYNPNASSYLKAYYTLNGDELLVTLPRPIESQQNGGYFIYFRAFGFTKKNFLGVYDFNFETLKVDQPIQSLQVGINVDSEIYLKGAKGNVNYRYTPLADQSLKEMSATGVASSPQMDTFVNNIGRGNITKTSSSLAPLESYTTKGSFADSRIKLYVKEVLSTILVLGLIISSIVFLTKLIKKRIFKKHDSNESLVPSSAKNMVICSAVSFSSALAICLYTVFIIFAGSFLSSMYSYGFQAFLTIVIIIISFGIYALIFFAPAIYLGWKKGFRWGIWTAILTIVWLVIFVFFIGVFLGLFGMSLDYPHRSYIE